MNGGDTLIGTGLSVVFGFARWRFPVVPPEIADAGLIAGIALITFGVTMPNFNLTMTAIVFFVAGCLCFGVAAHFAWKDGKPPVAEMPEQSTNAMGAVTDNGGIITQGQRGDNAIHPK
jgi:hypothetical protein